ncbi:GspH/FimT family pseudopilin [Rubrimonas cliftonensis]|uniref:Type II secretion system protein H n=1 Tax=Rubrimonas cliftonensis TaxID=89524 RepID=A0A1H3WR10_9RHOB|nr:GspH/FimT family pseudopilin [Rubrimonas cliftonensis]SDZ89191.1 general secretion pathway protein H [Rubrimonas cliftonensis]
MSAIAEPRTRAAGFTLLEMLVALAVVALLAAAAPRFVAPGAGGLDRATRLVAGELRAARAQAIERGAPAAVTFDVESGALRRTGAEAAFLPEDVSLSLVTAAEAEALMGAPGVVFFAEGGATGGAVTLARGGASATVAVRWLTGAVRVE